MKRSTRLGVIILLTTSCVNEQITTLQQAGRSIDSPAEVSKTATRVNIPILEEDYPVQPTGINGLPFAPVGLSECEEMNFYRIQFGLPDRFSDQPRVPQVSFGNQGFGWRESNCKNYVNTYCCYGYWQLYFDLHRRDHRVSVGYDACGVYSIDDYFGNSPLQKQKQACAAKALYDVVGLSAWDIN